MDSYAALGTNEATPLRGTCVLITSSKAKPRRSCSSSIRVGHPGRHRHHHRAARAGTPRPAAASSARAGRGGGAIGRGWPRCPCRRRREDGQKGRGKGCVWKLQTNPPIQTPQTHNSQETAKNAENGRFRGFLMVLLSRPLPGLSSAALGGWGDLKRRQQSTLRERKLGSSVRLKLRPGCAPCSPHSPRFG